MEAAKKLCFWRNVDASLGKQFAHLGMVGHPRKCSGIYQAGAARACTTVVPRKVRIVDAAATMGHDVNQRCKVSNKSNAMEYGLDAVCHFFNGKAHLQSIFVGGARVLDRQLGTLRHMLKGQCRRRANRGPKNVDINLMADQNPMVCVKRKPLNNPWLFFA